MVGRGARRSCKDVVMDMRQRGRMMLALDEVEVNAGDGDDNDGDSVSECSEWEEDGCEEVWCDVHQRVQRLGGVDVRVGWKRIKMRELLGRSCGCYDMGDENFRLLTRRSRSKFAHVPLAPTSAPTTTPSIESTPKTTHATTTTMITPPNKRTETLPTPSTSTPTSTSTTTTTTATQTTTTATTTTQTTTITPPPQISDTLPTPSRPRLDYGQYRPPKKKRRDNIIEKYFNTHKFCVNDWTVEMDRLEIKLENTWTKCMLYRNKYRKEHVCIWFDGGYLEGDNEKFPYKFDRSSMTLHDTDDDIIEYRRSVTM